MKAAFTIWDERISPVFDSTHMLMIVEIQNKKIQKKTYAAFDPGNDCHLADTLNHLGVDVLVCGAITHDHSSLIKAGKIKLISFVGGDIKDILEVYTAGEPLIPDFLMPGCSRNHSFA